MTDSQDLKNKIKAAKQEAGLNTPEIDTESDKARRKDMSFAARAGIELFATLLVGFALGWFLDSQFGTKPWLLITFLFIGVAAGFMNIYKLAIKSESDK